MARRIGPCRRCGDASRTKTGSCVSCARQAKARWAESHRDYFKKWRDANRDHLKRSEKAWREKNAERLRVSDSLKQKMHWQRHLESSRRWQARNKDARRITQEHRRARKASAPGVFSVEQARLRVSYYGGRCWICHRSEGRSLDHVVALCNGGSNWPSNLRPACRRCNSSKGAWERGRSPRVPEIMGWVANKRQEMVGVPCQ